jgi:hypothetical protein
MAGAQSRYRILIMTFFAKFGLPLAVFWAAFGARAVAAESIAVPPDTVACSFRAWAADPDPQGLNVRSAPNLKAAVLGHYIWLKNADAGNFVEFNVKGFRDGWFLIDGGSYGDYGDPPPPEPLYSGRGWVHGSRIAGQLFGTTHGLRAEPDSKATEKPLGKAPDAVVVKQLLACKGDWVKIDTDVGTGWVAGLCSNQVTTCP